MPRKINVMKLDFSKILDHDELKLFKFIKYHPDRLKNLAKDSKNMEDFKARLLEDMRKMFLYYKKEGWEFMDDDRVNKYILEIIPIAKKVFKNVSSKLGD